MVKLVEHLALDDALSAARIAAQDYHGQEIRELKAHSEQGCSASTFTVEYADDTKAIIQLRDGRLDTTLISLAHGMLGDIVPLVKAVKSDETMGAYGMPLIPGTRWEPLIMTSLEDDVAIVAQFGSILARCRMDGTSSDAIVKHSIIPRLQSIIRNDLPALEGDYPLLRPRLEGLLARADNLKQLPLSVTHLDPNPFNVSPTNCLLTNPQPTQVIIDDSSSPPKITGFIDWELATVLPFGMNAYQIRLIAVLNRKRVDCPDPATATPLAMAFWNAFTKDVEPQLKGAVLDAMSIGLILFCEFYEGVGTPSKEGVQNTVARLDWLEEMYRPLCK